VAQTHVVEQGEHLPGIAKLHGFRDFNTILNDGDNAGLKEDRKNPNVLFPGDSIVIPDKTAKNAAGATGKLHIFNVKLQQVLLQIVVEDTDETPLAATPSSLKVKEKTVEQPTGADGMVKAFINEEDKDGELLLKDKKLNIRLRIGHLNPLIVDPASETDSKKREEAIIAWQDRLNNLGYFAGFTTKDTDQLQWALQEFQRDHGWVLDPSKESGKQLNGQTDQDTRDKLEEIYGC
jgi:Putative peptidoglycan binding domain